MLNRIFSPARIKDLEIPNRLVVPAMVMNYCNIDGTPTERFFAYYEARARGGWGLIITEDYAVDPIGKGYTHIPGLWDDSLIELHSELPRRVHAAGGKIFAQIYHAGRQTNDQITGAPPVAPSPIPCPTKKQMPRVLSLEEIQELVEKFGDCALRAKQAGFDGVEVHGAHGYLVAQFLSAYSNKRTDRYGGCFYNRTRFAREIIADIRRKAGIGFPVLFRISGDEFVPGGRAIEESKAIAMVLENAGVDGIHVSAGVYGSRYAVVPPSRIPTGWITTHAQEVKQVVSVPVITVGRIADPFIAESVIASGKADFVAMGRASIADPELPNKARAGNFGDIIYCVGCMQGCAEKIRKMGQSAGCMLNPMTGRESEVGITPVETARKVLIVGGGVAGMETAIICARRGHDVVLFEKEPELGGNFRLAAIPPGKGEICSFIAWQKQELDKYKVRIELNSFVDENSILREKPDVVVVATGSTPVSFSVPSDGIAAVSALDVLAGRTVVGDRVVIVGGGMVGAETANHLANHGKKVCLVEVKADIAADEELNTRFLLLEDLRKADVTAYVNCTVSGIDSNGVNILLDGRALHLPADTVVFALGGNPENAFAETRRGETPRWLIVGDSKKMGNAMDAVLDGFFAGLNID